MSMTTPFYELAWVLHTLFLFEVSSTIILDMWFVLLIYFLCKASDSSIKILKVLPRRNHDTNLTYSKRLNIVLKRFHTVHVNLNEYLRALRKMYKWLSFVPLCNATMCTCLILLLMSKEVNWRFAPHMLPMFAEIFTYNWFGEQIKTKAIELKHAMLEFDWTGLRMKDKKSYYIILIFIQNECGIKTAVGNDLSLITMTAVLKVTYQAFTVLRSLDK
ncbi:uncharacterized protein [Battus philenor]|uniref:uncharacterized protein n=1 Tax=Battus philenor TaxID=42288 RepID=UPI0035CFD378